MSAGITPGEWILETVATSVGLCHKIGPFPGAHESKPTTHACIYGDQLRVGIDDELPRAKELLANARLFVEAGTVTNETGLTPRQLADQRGELLNMLRLLTKKGTKQEAGLSWNVRLKMARDLIAKTTGGAS